MTDLPAIISRAEAKAQGLNRYFTGKPCVHGHISVRAVINHCCMECVKIKKHSMWKTRKYFLPSTDSDNFIRGARPCKRCGCTERHGGNKRCVNCTARENKNKIITDEQKIEYYKKSYNINKKSILARNWLRKQRIKDATPRNMSELEKEKMSKFFANCPSGHQVDHIVPIISDKICGCNCIANLQYLTNSENRSKSNKWPTCQKSMQPACFDNDDNGVKE